MFGFCIGQMSSYLFIKASGVDSIFWTIIRSNILKVANVIALI